MFRESLDRVRIIQNRLRVAQSRQKCYADHRLRASSFGVGDRIFLRVSRIKSVMRFGKRRKLSPRYIDPFEIFQTDGDVAYELALPQDLLAVHLIFHIPKLRHYISDESLMSFVGSRFS